MSPNAALSAADHVGDYRESVRAVVGRTVGSTP